MAGPSTPIESENMSRRRTRGYTLAEMLAVCAVLVIVAATAIPSATPLAASRADAAAGEVATALRFAREDAIRSGDYRMFSCEQSANRIRVYALTVTGPNIGESNVAVLHPVLRQPYTLLLANRPGSTGMTITNCSFVFVGNTSATTVAFDGTGSPVRGTGNAADRAQFLKEGYVRVGTGTAERTIKIDVTGYVNVP
jgi:prepilin-type N-terminal cleavage/methylation domain-containing protein